MEKLLFVSRIKVFPRINTNIKRFLRTEHENNGLGTKKRGGLSKFVKIGKPTLKNTMTISLLFLNKFCNYPLSSLYPGAEWSLIFFCPRVVTKPVATRRIFEGFF